MEDQLLLIKPFTNEEIKKELFSIEDKNSLGSDGYGSYFFKASWPIVGEEICEAIHEFFGT